jgi:DNA-binding transcriptional ArsR family regulator
MSSEVSGLRALAHPVRLRILSLLTGTELSAAEVARELGLTHANASYHLRQLAAAGQLEVASEVRIRGGVAKRYRHPWGTAPAPSADEESRGLYLDALAAELKRRFPLRRREGGAQVVDAELWVDTEVWSEVRELVNRAVMLLHGRARPPRTNGTVHVNLTAAVFEIADENS